MANDLYRLTAGGSTRWHGLARLRVETLKKQAGVGSIRRMVVLPIAIEAYPLPAKCPKLPRPSTPRFTKRFGLVMPRWDTNLCPSMEEGLVDEVQSP